jgi:hypothetical protein
VFTPPWSVARGGDLDGDGVADVWGRVDEGLVAWSVADLAAGTVTELARIGVPEGTGPVAVADGLVWTGALLRDRVEQDAAWAFPESGALTTADATTTLTGGGWGRTVSEPAWVDVTGDGVDDLALFDDEGFLDVFDGTGLAAGGAHTPCDADIQADADGAYDLDWLPDLDADGAVDALLILDNGASGELHRIVSGRVLLGLAAGDDLAAWEGDRMVVAPTCDITGDGVPELVVDDRTATLVYDGASLAAAGDPDAAYLGSVPRDDDYFWCIPDVDGDGGAELIATAGSRTHYGYLGAQLDPAAPLALGDAWFVLTNDGVADWTSPSDVGDLDGDGADDPAWLTRVDASGSVYTICLLDDTAPLALGGELAFEDAALTCFDSFEAVDDAEAVDVTGDGVPDLAVYGADTAWGRAFVAWDAAVPGTMLALEPVTAADPAEAHRMRDAGFGPDVHGVGGPALWTYWYTYDQGMATLEVVFAE